VKRYTRILVADDSNAFRFFVKNSIKNSFKNIVVIEAKNGKEAVMEFQKNLPQLTLLDIKMPEVDGTLSLKAIKKLRHDAKVIITSAFSTEQRTINNLISEGASSFLPKPMNRMLLLKTVSDFINDIPYAATHNKIKKYCCNSSIE